MRRYFENNDLNLHDGKPKLCHLAQRQLDCKGTVGLVLRWMTSTMERNDLATEFGLVESVSNKYLHFGISIILAALRDDPDAEIVRRNQDQQYLQWNDSCIYMCQDSNPVQYSSSGFH